MFCSRCGSELITDAKFFHFYCCVLSAVLVLPPMLSKQLVPSKFENIVFVVVAFVVHSTLLCFPPL